MKKLLFAVLLCIAGLAQAATVEIAGVRFEDRIKLGSSELQLNGVGLRTRFFISVYAIGLYLPNKSAEVADVLAMPGPKRLHIAILRDVVAGQFADAVSEGIRKNHSDAELEAIKTRIEELKTTITQARMGHKGTVVDIEWLPESGGTRLTMDGKQMGKDIAGEDFYRAILKIWLGAKPIQDHVKEALLGKRQ